MLSVNDRIIMGDPEHGELYPIHDIFMRSGQWRRIYEAFFVHVCISGRCYVDVDVRGINETLRIEDEDLFIDLYGYYATNLSVPFPYIRYTWHPVRLYREEWNIELTLGPLMYRDDDEHFKLIPTCELETLIVKIMRLDPATPKSPHGLPRYVLRLLVAAEDDDRWRWCYFVHVQNLKRLWGCPQSHVWKVINSYLVTHRDGDDVYTYEDFTPCRSHFARNRRTPLNKAM
jgi:hypothetical protein